MAALRPLRHNRPECDGGWSASVDEDVWDVGSATRVMLLCWTCGARVDLKAMTPASDDPGGYGYGSRGDLREDWVADRIPDPHRPRLSESTSGTWSLPASVPPLRVSGVAVYVEQWFDYGRADDAYQWIVTTPRGDYLGSVARYHTPRGAVRFRWGTVEDVAGHGEGETSLRSAARRIAAATLPPLSVPAQSRSSASVRA